MKKALLLFFLGTASLVLLTAVGFGIFLTVFDPNDYKQLMSTAGEKATGKKLVFQDDIEFAFFPVPGLATGRLLLLDPKEFGGEPFLVVEKAFASLDLAPLFNREISIRKLVLHGASLNLVINEAGHKNWEYGFGENEKKEAGKAGKNGDDTVVPLNEGNAKQTPGSDEKKYSLRLRKVAFPTSRISYRNRQQNTSYSLALEECALEEVNSAANVVMAFSGNVRDEGNARSADFIFKGESGINAAGERTLGVRSLEITTAHPDTLPLSLKSNASLTWDAVNQTLRLENLQGIFSTPEKADGAKLETKFTGRAGCSLKEGGAIAIEGSLATSRLNLDALLATITPPDQGTKADAVRGAPNLSRPVVNDAGPGMPNKPARQNAANSSRPNSSPPLSAKISLDLTCEIEDMLVKGVLLHNVRTEIKATRQLANAACSFQVFGGSATGTVTVDFSSALPAFSFTADLAGVKMQEVTQAVNTKYTISGTAAASLNVTGQGLDQKTALHSLKGKAQVHIKNGHVYGFALIPLTLPGIKPVPANFSFERASASLNITKGNAVSNDITLLSPVLTAQGGGTLHLPYNTADLSIDFLLGGLPPAVPVSISGPYSSLSYRVDMQAFLRNATGNAAQMPGTAKNLLRNLGGAILRP